MVIYHAEYTKRRLNDSTVHGYGRPDLVRGVRRRPRRQVLGKDEPNLPLHRAYLQGRVGEDAA